MILGFNSKGISIKGILILLHLAEIDVLYTSVSGGIKLDHEILESINTILACVWTYMQTHPRCQVQWFFTNQFNAAFLTVIGSLGHIQYWNLDEFTCRFFFQIALYVLTSTQLLGWTSSQDISTFYKDASNIFSQKGLPSAAIHALEVVVI